MPCESAQVLIGTYAVKGEIHESMRLKSMIEQMLGMHVCKKKRGQLEARGDFQLVCQHVKAAFTLWQERVCDGFQCVASFSYHLYPGEVLNCNRVDHETHLQLLSIATSINRGMIDIQRHSLTRQNVIKLMGPVLPSPGHV